MKVLEAGGASIPALGLGTWQLDGRGAERMVEHALEIGYRHIDTAQAYGNEAGVGRGLRNAGVPRSEVFLVTKVWHDRLTRERLSGSVDESLARLGVDRVDLLLIHWPPSDGPLEPTIEALNAVRDAGRTRHVGVSNFTTALMARARELSDAPLVCNQVEYHPFLEQSDVLASTRAAGAAVIAYSPLARGRAVGNEILREIGHRHGKSAAQVSLRWLLQQDGVGAIPKTSDPGRCEENFRVFDFELSEAEMERIHALAEPDGRIIDPAGLAPAWD